MARARKKENPIKETVEAILKKRNINYNEWEKEVINKKKIEVMSDEDKDWTAEVVKEASLNVIMEEVVKENKKTDYSNSATKHEHTTANVN